MTRALIIHGTKGSPEGNWFPWLSDQLRADGFEVHRPRFPTPQGQSLSSWRQTLERENVALDDRSIVIGHSLGALFALRILEELAGPILGCVLVSGFTGSLGIEEYDDLNATFVASPIAWEVVRRNCARFVCVSGENDPYVPNYEGEHIARSLHAPLIVVPGGGHLNAEFGFHSFPRLLDEMGRADLLRPLR